MENHTMNRQDESDGQVETYEAPQLIEFGDAIALTLGHGQRDPEHDHGLLSWE